MTIMLILNAVLAVAIVTAILSLLGRGVASDRARMAANPRHSSRRAPARTGAHPAPAGYRGYGRARGLSA